MLSNKIEETTLGATNMVGNGFKNALRGAVMFGALAGGAVLLAHLALWATGLTLFGLAGVPLLTAVLAGAAVGAAVQFATSFIPWGSKRSEPSAPSQGVNRDGIDSPTLARGQGKTIDDLPDINPDAQANNVARLGDRPSPMRDGSYAATVDASQNAPAAQTR